MRKIPFALFLLLCLCLCACSAGGNEPAATMDALTLNLYHGDENCEKLLKEPVTIPELAPEYIMEALCNKGVLGENVPVNSFLMDKTGVIRLDLGGSFAEQICAMGTSGEYIMMGSLVNTFLEAYDASSLMLQVDGATLETGHTIYDFPMSFFE